MHVIHCYSTLTVSPQECANTVQAMDSVLEQHFKGDYALYYEEIPPCDAPPRAPGRLYIMIASLSGTLDKGQRASLSADLSKAVPCSQYIAFCSHEPDAVAHNGHYLLDEQ